MTDAPGLSADVVIAGGGPAGLMCSYLLARAGIDVTVLPLMTSPNNRVPADVSASAALRQKRG